MNYRPAATNGVAHSVFIISLLTAGAATAQSADVPGGGAATGGEKHGVTLDQIVVTADRKNSFGAAFLEAGAFRDARIIDTPLTVSVITKDLINTQQALSIFDAARNTSGVSQAQINTIIYSNLSIRGNPVSNVTNYRLNGVLPIMNFIDMPMEDKDRVEVLKGAAGLYYGFAAPSGIVNLVTERPTVAPLNELDLFGDIHGSVGGHVDVSRTWGDVGMRVNAAASSLETGIEKTDGHRAFISGAFDWRPTSKLLVQFDGEYIYKIITEPTEIALPAPVNGVIPLPPLQDPAKNLGAKWLYAASTEYNVLGRAKYDFSSNWSASIAVGQSDILVDRRYSSFSGYDLSTGDGKLGVAITHNTEYKSTIYRGDVVGAFQTGPIVHELLIGVSDNVRDTYIPTAVRYSFHQNLYDPVDIPSEPTPPRIIANPSSAKDFGAYIFDRLTYHDWLQFTVGYRWENYSDISKTSTYKITPSTYSYGVMVKPWRNVSVYGNYIEGLEEGGIASQIAVNAGEILPAAVSTQKEFGVKFEPIHSLLLTAAYFDINRASTFLNSSNVFVENGRASYKGVEFSASGEITRDLSVSVSGVSLQATQVSGAASVVGKEIENTAKFSGSIFAAYKVPMVPGLTLSAGAFYVGARAVNATNNAFVPAYTTFSAGASYAAVIAHQPIIFRVNGENITNKRYWAATGSSLLDEGLPATVKFSISTRF